MTTRQQANREEFKLKAQAMRDIKSQDHISWDGDYELYRVYGHIYRAHYTNAIDTTTNNRIGRWECKVCCDLATQPQVKL